MPAEQFLDSFRSKFIKPKREFKVMKLVLKGVKSKNKTKISNALKLIGYQKMKKDLYQFGHNTITLTKVKLGNDVGHKLDFEREGRSDQCVLFGDIVIDKKHWKDLSSSFHKIMKRYKKAQSKHPDHPQPKTPDEIRDFIALGETKSRIHRKQKEKQEIYDRLASLQAKIKYCLACGHGPKGIIIYSDGPDASGKTSTGVVVLDALVQAGFKSRIVAFKAPNSKERKDHWLKRYKEKGMPQNQEVTFWDRGPAGDIVYQDHSKKMIDAMCIELNGFEARLQAEKILLIKMQIYAERDKQCKTFGKRLGRAYIAQEILKDKNIKLTEDQEYSLTEIAFMVDSNDYQSFKNFRPVEDKFLSVVSRTQAISNWLVGDATDRHACRLYLIRDFSARIDKDHIRWVHR